MRLSIRQIKDKNMENNHSDNLKNVEIKNLVLATFLFWRIRFDSPKLNIETRICKMFPFTHPKQSYNSRKIDSFEYFLWKPTTHLITFSSSLFPSGLLIFEFPFHFEEETNARKLSRSYHLDHLISTRIRNISYSSAQSPAFSCVHI